MKVSLSDIFAQQAAESLAFVRSTAGAEQAERNAAAFRERETARRAWELRAFVAAVRGYGRARCYRFRLGVAP